MIREDPKQIDQAVERQRAKRQATIMRKISRGRSKGRRGHGKLGSEIREEALRNVRRMCRVQGCRMYAADDGWCTAHRSTKPRTMDDRDPPVEGLCNWPAKRGQKRCRMPVERCALHARYRREMPELCQ